MEEMTPLEIVNRCIDLQKQLDEYKRFIGDLVIILAKPERSHMAIEHDIDEADFIWDQTYKLISENEDLKERLAQFSQGAES